MISFNPSQQSVYLPSMDEIRSRCQEIQATWSPAEKDRRQSIGGKKKYAPRVLTCYLDTDDMEYASR